MLELLLAAGMQERLLEPKRTPNVLASYFNGNIELHYDGSPWRCNSAPA